MTTKHYHTLWGSPGYMPDTNNVHRTKSEAQNDAHFLVEQDRDMGRRVTGNKRDGYFIFRTGNDGVYIYDFTCNVSECYEEDCLTELG